MTAVAPATAVTEAELLAGLPAPLVVPGALARLAELDAASGTRTLVLDDDPTGTQTLHDVPVVASWSEADLSWATAHPGVGVVLTNTRSLAPERATVVVTEVAEALERLSTRGGWPARVVSRGDSTLRGHVPLEPDALASVAAAHGRPYDGLLLTPAYLEAGRATVGDVHHTREDGRWLPVGQSEYASDATFGYRSSNLREWLAEKSDGRWPADRVVSVDLRTIREGGPDAVAAVLATLSGGAPAVVNAASEHDLEVVALAVAAVERDGRRLLHRCGPSMVRVLAGMPRRPPLRGPALHPQGPRAGHGLVVVGSHTATTTRQVQALQRAGAASLELDVGELLAGRLDTGALAGEVVAALGAGDAVLATSRALHTGRDGRSSLSVAGAVSAALTRVVAEVARRAPLRFVVAKGGITSHDVAVHGLGIRRAVVAGQVFDGLVSVWSTVDADVGAGLPYVVFAGNVGDEDSLAQVVEVLAAPPGPAGAPEPPP